MRKAIIEIDGESHFGSWEGEDDGVRFVPSMEKYMQHLMKERWLQRQGWEVWRFSNLEIESYRDEERPAKLFVDMFLEIFGKKASIEGFF